MLYATPIAGAGSPHVVVIGMSIQTCPWWRRLQSCASGEFEPAAARSGVFSTVTTSPLKKPSRTASACGRRNGKLLNGSERTLREHADVGYESKVFLILPGSFLSTRLRSAQIWCGSRGGHQGVSG